MIKPICAAIAATVLLSACATPSDPVVMAPAPAAVAQAQAAATAPTPETRRLKRKIAIGRFTNTSNYGRALLTDRQLAALGERVSDILSAELVASQSFLVFERPDVDAVQQEGALSGQAIDIIGVDTLIVGSLTEFGRKTEGRSGFASTTKRQVARAKVDLRLVDVRTGRAYFATSGAGEAALETGTVLGFGDRAAYDETLNDRAIAAAIGDVIGGLVSRLEDRPWRSDILRASGNEVIIAGGARQGLAPGDRLAVMRAGEAVKSATTGMTIDLPAAKIAEIEVLSTFGQDETNEGAVTSLVSGALPPRIDAAIFVSEL